MAEKPNEQRTLGGFLDPGNYGRGDAPVSRMALDYVGANVPKGVYKTESGDRAIDPSAVGKGAGGLATGMARMQRSIEDLARQGKTDEAKVVWDDFRRTQEEIYNILLNLKNKPEMGTKEYSDYARALNVAGRQGDPSAGVELANTRSAVRREQARLKLGGEGATLSEDSRQQWEGVKESLTAEMTQTTNEAFKAAAEGNQGLANQLTMQVGSQGNLLSEIETILNYNMRQNAATIDKAMGFLGNLAGILSVGQIASRAFIQEPFRYEFMPAMGTLGKSGEIGSMMSSAFTAAEENQVNLRQMSLMAGLGGMYGGWKMMRGASGPGGTAAGVGMMAVSGLAATGMGVEMLQDLGVIKDESDIISAKVAEAAVDPARLMDYYTNSRAGLMQAGAGPNMGFTTGQGVDSMDTGNTILDEMSGGPGDITRFRRGGNLLGNLRGLGYSGEQLGQYLSSASMQMRGDKDDLTDAVGLASVLEAGFGVGADQSFQNMASLQRAGVNPEDVTSRMYQSMGAVADEDGNVSNYAQNVLVPALNQVVESMAIQNVARSSEELTKEIYGFRAMLGDSNTNLGRLVKASPEAFSRVYGSMVQGTKSALNDPARMAYNLSLGSSFMDIMSGDPSVIMNQVNQIMRSPAASMIDFENTTTANPALRGILANLGGQTGIQDPQILLSLLQMAQGGNLTFEGVKTLQDEGAAALGDRREEVESTELNAVRVSLAEQMNAAATASLAVFEQIQELQSGISDFITGGNFDTYLQGGINDIKEGILEVLGQTSGQIRDRQETAENEEWNSLLNRAIAGTGAEDNANLFAYNARTNAANYSGINLPLGWFRDNPEIDDAAGDAMYEFRRKQMDKPEGYTAPRVDMFDDWDSSLEGVEETAGTKTYIIRVRGPSDSAVVERVIASLDGRFRTLERNVA